MKPMQYDIERHTPEKLARAFYIAADTAERNPFLSPDERIKRARDFRERAEEFESRVARPLD